MTNEHKNLIDTLKHGNIGEIDGVSFRAGEIIESLAKENEELRGALEEIIALSECEAHGIAREALA